MINYAVTKAQADKFEAALVELRSAPEDERVDPRLRQAEIAALESQLSDLRKDMVREAFEQGYTRGMLKVTSAVYTAFRRGWQPAEVEDMLRRMSTLMELKAETKAFEEWAAEREQP